MSSLKKILFVARDDGGCGFFRCKQPASFIKRMGLADTEVVLQHPTHEQLLNSDLVIMQDTGSVTASNIGRFCVENKIPYVVEFDDFVHHVSPNNEGGYGAWNPSTLFVHRSMQMMRAAFGVTVSTEQLAREYFPYNPTIFVIPNYLDKERWENPVVKKQDDKIRIGWCGGNAHADDLFMVSKVIEKIVKEHKGKVVFETMGMTSKELHGVFNLENTGTNECPSCGHEGQVHHYPGENLNDYPLALASKGWDIAIAPVVNNAFGNCKSFLKVMEYAATGYPVVASPIVPYKQAAQQGASILFADGFDEWYNQLTSLIKSTKKRDELAKANKEWITKYWIDDNAKLIFEVYRQVIAQSELLLGKKEDRVKNI